MKKFICLIITLIMCTTTFAGVISSADNTQQNVQSNIQIISKPLFNYYLPNWFLITDCSTAKNILKNQPEILNKCTPEFFSKYKICVLSFSLNASATVTYTEPFKYNVSYPELLCKCIHKYVDYLIVDKDMNFNGTVTFNNNYTGNNTSDQSTLKLTQIYLLSTDKESFVKRVDNVSVKSPKSKTIKATWKKLNEVSGYKIKVSTNKNFKPKKTEIYYVDTNKRSITINKLKRQRKYYIKVRAYKIVIVNGKKTTVYSKKWSAVKTIKTK